MQAVYTAAGELDYAAMKVQGTCTELEKDFLVRDYCHVTVHTVLVLVMVTVMVTVWYWWFVQHALLYNLVV